MSAKVEGGGLLSPRLKFNLSCYLILLLPVGMLTLFIYVPVFWAFSGSLFEFEIGGDSEFVGLANYYEFIFLDPTTYPSLLNMLFITCFLVCVRLSFPLVVAKLIYSLKKEKYRYVYRIVFLIPIVVPGVAVQLIWSGMIYNDRGLLNEFLRLFDFTEVGFLLALGFSEEFLRSISPSEWTMGWLSDPRTALLAVVFVGFPFVGGFEVLIYYAGLTGIPESVNEAAEIEGCTGIKKFFLIDIPMVMSQLKLILILTIIMGVQGFEHIFILTRGGPGFETTVPGLWMYFNAFSFQRMGYACAIGVCLFILIFTLTFLNFRYFKSTEELEGKR